MGEIPIWFFYLKEMYRGKFEYPEIRKKYKAYAYACKALIVELELLATNIKSFDEFKRVAKIKKGLDMMFDYQIAHYEKAYSLKNKKL